MKTGAATNLIQREMASYLAMTQRAKSKMIKPQVSTSSHGGRHQRKNWHQLLEPRRYDEQANSIE